MKLTDEQTASEEAHYGNREALEAMTKRAEEAEAKLAIAMNAVDRIIRSPTHDEAFRLAVMAAIELKGLDDE